MLLPYVMTFNRIGCREKYAHVAALLGERTEGLSLDAASLAGVEAVRRLCDTLGIPKRLRDVSVPQDELGYVAQRCLETQGRIATNNPRVASLADTEAILQAAY